jgi:hypothetical protein
MKKYLICVFVLGIYTDFFAQDLLLVIDENFGGKTLDSFDALTYTQHPGDLHWNIDPGDSGTFQYTTMIANLDGTGAKLWSYAWTQDSLIYFPRRANAYTDADNLIVEANAHGEIDGVKVMSGALLDYPWNLKHGYYEFRAKLPEGTGIMSSCFLFGDRDKMGYGCDTSKNGLDPNWQEIDIWETTAHDIHAVRNNIHWSKDLPEPSEECDKPCGVHCQNGYAGENKSTDLDFHNEFHTFGLYWDQNYVIFLIDGFVYRYWVFQIFGTDHDPIYKQLGDPEPLSFPDAMHLYIGMMYGTQHIEHIAGFKRENKDDPESPFVDFEDLTADDLFGPHPDYDIPSSELVLDYFRYWTFLPCDNEFPFRVHSLDGTDQTNIYFTDKIVDGYHTNNQTGVYETGRNVYCANSEILPTLTSDGVNESPYSYSNQLNLIAANTIHLQPGFHAKAANFNYPIPHQFNAKIATCANISPSQPQPVINFMDEEGDGSFIGGFMASLKNMIYESYKDEGPFKLPLQGDEYETQNPQEILSIIDSTNQYYLKIYPNPVDNELTIQLDELYSTPLQFNLKDATGQLVIEPTPLNQLHTLHLSDLSSGIYFLEITSLDGGGFRQFYKIIKK